LGEPSILHRHGDALGNRLDPSMSVAQAMMALMRRLRRLPASVLLSPSGRVSAIAYGFQPRARDAAFVDE